MAISVTNKRDSQSLNGTSVTVTVAGSDLTKLKDIEIGQLIEVDSSKNTGVVCSVDYLGHSFKIKPNMPTGNLASTGTAGYLKVNETINIQN